MERETGLQPADVQLCLRHRKAVADVEPPYRPPPVLEIFCYADFFSLTGNEMTLPRKSGGIHLTFDRNRPGT